MPKFKSKPALAGITLIELMVSVGVVGVVALAAGGVLTQLFRSQHQIRIKDQANEFEAALGRFLYSDALCTAGLQNMGFPSTNLTVANYRGYGATGSTANLAAGTTVAPQVTIQSISLVDKGTTPVSVVVNGTAYQQYMAQINLTLQHQASNPVSLAPRTYEFPVLVSGGQVRFCRANHNPPPNVCATLGMTVDSYGNCTPSGQCVFQGSYALAVCSPSHSGCGSINVSNPLTGGTSCPTGSTFSQTGSQGGFDYSYNCGKKCTQVVSRSLTFFVCMRCQ